MESILATKKGIFMGVCHDDNNSHLWILDELSKNKGNIKFLFIETNHFIQISLLGLTK